MCSWDLLPLLISCAPAGIAGETERSEGFGAQAASDNTVATPRRAYFIKQILSRISGRHHYESQIYTAKPLLGRLSYCDKTLRRVRV